MKKDILGDQTQGEGIKRLKINRIIIFSSLGLLIALFWMYTDPKQQSITGRQVVIRFWNGFTGPDGERIVKLVRQFNEENPDVQVRVQRIDWNTYYNKVFIAGLGGRSPDVFVVHESVLPRFIHAGLLEPIDRFVSGVQGLPAADFDTNAWCATHSDNRQWGIPLDVHPFGMYCNRTLFREAGLTNSAGDILIPQTREELLTAMKRLTRDTDGDGKPDQWGYVMTTMRMIFQSVMAQNGGALVSNNGRTCRINSPENRETMQFFYDLIYREKVCPKPEGFDSWVGFLQGKAGIVFEGIWMLSELGKSDLDFIGAALPQIGRQPGVWADSHVLCLSKTVGRRQQEAGWKFIKYLSDHSLEWAQTGQIPVRKSLRAAETFREMKIQNAFAALIPYVYFSPAVPYKLELDTELELAFEKVLRQTATPEEALLTAEENINKIIARVYADHSGSKEK